MRGFVNAGLAFPFEPAIDEKWPTNQDNRYIYRPDCRQCKPAVKRPAQITLSFFLYSCSRPTNATHTNPFFDKSSKTDSRLPLFFQSRLRLAVSCFPFYSKNRVMRAQDFRGGQDNLAREIARAPRLDSQRSLRKRRHVQC